MHTTPLASRSRAVPISCPKTGASLTASTRMPTARSEAAPAPPGLISDTTGVPSTPFSTIPVSADGSDLWRHTVLIWGMTDSLRPPLPRPPRPPRPPLPPPLLLPPAPCAPSTSSPTDRPVRLSPRRSTSLVSMPTSDVTSDS
eukprot:18056-Prymnesium_polylepis.1